MKIEFELGVTPHSQRVTLIVDKTGQRPAYAITKHAASQRDDTVQLYGLTDEDMDLLAKAVKIARGGKSMTAADFCKTCSAPHTPPVAVLLRCGLCRVVNGKLPPTQYKPAKEGNSK